MKMVQVLKLFGHSKLKLWAFFWTQGECEWQNLIWDYSHLTNNALL